MARIAWNASGSRFYEAGVDRGVLYIDALEGIPWTGLISVEEAPNGAEAQAYYIDGIKYLNLARRDEYEATIQAFTYPIEFGQCDGTNQVRPGLFFGQQKRKPFGFSYRTMVGNEVEGISHGYKIHLVYDALALPANRSTSTIGDSVEATEFSWSISTKPKVVSGSAPTAHVVIDSRYTHPVKMAAVEDIIYGSESGIARLPLPEELIAIFDVALEWEITDNEDGTFSINGPDENVLDIGNGMVQLNHPDITIINADTFSITY